MSGLEGGGRGQHTSAVQWSVPSFELAKSASGLIEAAAPSQERHLDFKRANFLISYFTMQLYPYDKITLNQNSTLIPV